MKKVQKALRTLVLTTLACFGMALASDSKTVCKAVAPYTTECCHYFKVIILIYETDAMVCWACNPTKCAFSGGNI